MSGIRSNSATGNDRWSISECQIRGDFAFALVSEEAAYDNSAWHMRSP